MNQPIYKLLADAVTERDVSRGAMPLPGAKDTAVKAMLASTDYALYYTAAAARGFGHDFCIQSDGEHATGLPGKDVSRRGLELAALVLADVAKREKPPGGGSPAWSGNIDDFLVQMDVPKNDRGPDDPGGPASAWPVEYRIAA